MNDKINTFFTAFREADATTQGKILAMFQCCEKYGKTFLADMEAHSDTLSELVATIEKWRQNTECK